MRLCKTGLYIHIPFCTKRCAYCDFCSRVHKKEDEDLYTSALCGEISARLAPNVLLDSVFFGGGTPSAIRADSLQGILTAARDACKISECAEITVECNPESLTARKAARYRAAGVNRISLGVQSLDAEVLKNAGRRHTPEQATEAVLIAAAAGFENISVDVMTGLPDQSIQSLRETLSVLSGMPEIKHISVYGLTLSEGTAMQRSGYTPDEETLAEMYAAAQEIMASGGFEQYEISNFCRKGFECRHNLRYWRRGTYIGCGLSASSFDGSRRMTNTYDFAEYVKGNYADFCESPDRAQSAAEFIMLHLRLKEGLPLEDLMRLFGEDPTEKAQELIATGMLVLEDNRLKIPPKYFYISNAIIARLI